MPEWFRRLFASSIYEDEEKTRTAQTLNNLGWVAISTVLIVMAGHIMAENGLQGVSRQTLPLLLALLVVTQLLLRMGYVSGAGGFLVLSVWMVITYEAYHSGGLRDISVYVYPILVLLAALLLNWRAGLVTGLFSAAAIWYFAYQEYLGRRGFSVDSPLSYARDLTALLFISSILTYFLIQRLNRSLSDAKLELKERLRAEEKLQTQARYLTALHETTFGLLNRLELNPLLESILLRAGELLETPHVGIDLVSEDGSVLMQEVGTGRFKEWNKSYNNKGEWLTGKVWECAETVVVDDYETWEGKNPEAAAAGFHATIGTPLKLGNKVLGVLLVAYTDSQRKISDDQAALLERLAALASLAIDNARLYEESQKDIQRRKTIESDLRASEERFRKVFNNNNIAVSIVTLEEGIFLEANEAFWKLTGLIPEEALGRSSLELNLWKDPGERAQFVRDLLEMGSIENEDVEFKSGAGQVRSSIAYYELITIRNELCILCMFYDISEQRQAQRDLLESEERFRKIFQSSPVAICISTLETGNMLDANDAYWTLTGYNPHRVLGNESLDAGIWEDAAVRRSFIEELKQKRRILNPDYTFHNRRSGEIRYTIALAELIELYGQPCILSMFYDITEQKLVENALKDAEARTRAIIASIPDMIFEISKGGVFLDFMASADLVPVMEPQEFIGRNINDLFPAAIARQTMFSIERALATSQMHAFEYGLPPGEEVQFFEARVAPVTPESVIIMVRDISQRKWVETEREKLIGELEEKNSELERFTYTVSHDLKSPVITIRGFLGFLEQDAVSGNLPRLRGDIQRIADATDKMQTLLNELLELSRVGRLVNPPKLTPFNEIVHDALNLVQGRLQANQVRVHVQDGMEDVFVDRPRMLEALQNLLDNAAKFVRENPRVEIGQEGVKDGLPVFFVRDNGIGIDPIHHERIFGLFNKLDAASEGTGIGLALVRRIIEIHKGRIWVQSEPGKGATFYFTLPKEA